MEPAAQDSDLAMVLQFREAPGFDETAERNRQRLTDAIDAIEAGDIDRFWEMFDPDVTFYEASCLPYGGAHHGLEATKRGYQQMSDTYSKMKTVMEAVLASRDLCILYQTITFEVKATGRTGTLPVCELFRFRDGKVVEWRALYFDACMVAQAITGS